MVNGNQQYLQELYDHVESIQDDWEMQESAQETLPVEQRIQKHINLKMGLSREVGGLVVFLQQTIA